MTKIDKIEKIWDMMVAEVAVRIIKKEVKDRKWNSPEMEKIKKERDTKKMMQKILDFTEPEKIEDKGLDEMMDVLILRIIMEAAMEYAKKFVGERIDEMVKLLNIEFDEEID